VGYIIVIIVAIVLVPLLYVLMARRPGRSSSEGQRPIGKPVMVEEPASDEPTPAASSMKRDTTAAQKRTPPA
jgi:hypothetical protein